MPSRALPPHEQRTRRPSSTALPPFGRTAAAASVSSTCLRLSGRVALLPPRLTSAPRIGSLLRWRGVAGAGSRIGSTESSEGGVRSLALRDIAVIELSARGFERDARRAQIVGSLGLGEGRPFRPTLRLAPVLP